MLLKTTHALPAPTRSVRSPSPEQRHLSFPVLSSIIHRTPPTIDPGELVQIGVWDSQLDEDDD